MDRTLSSEVFCPGNYNGEKYGKSETSAWEGEECFADTGQRQNKSLKESSIEIADWKHFHFSLETLSLFFLETDCLLVCKQSDKAKP